MIVNRLVVTSLREKWRLLRLYRFAGSVLADYRILQNEARRLLNVLEKKS
ncbi:YlcG family protein [Citrobacter sp. ANG330]